MARELEAAFASYDDEPPTTTASRRAARAARRKALEDFDRMDVSARTRSFAPVSLGGGAFTVSFARDRELKRLRALQ